MLRFLVLQYFVKVLGNLQSRDRLILQQLDVRYRLRDVSDRRGGGGRGRGTLKKKSRIVENVKINIFPKS